MLNAAAPLCCLHDRLESNENIPNNELLCVIQQSLCLLVLVAKLLFGKDLPNLAAKHSELTKSLSKNLQKTYNRTPYASGSFSRFPSQVNYKYNSQQFRGKPINNRFRHSTSTGKQRLAPEATSVQPFRPRRDHSDKQGPSNTNLKTGCTAKTFSFSLANFNSRSNNLEYSSRLSPAISHTTCTNSQTRDYSLKRKYFDFKRRNIKTSVKRGNSPCQFHQRSFLQPPLSCTQEGWRPAPSDRFKRPKSIRCQRTFSDGKHFMPQTNS